jgi:hypothetical protein
MCSARLSELCKRRISLSAPAFEAEWSAVQASFERQHDSLLGRYPEAAEEIALIRMVLTEIREMIKFSPKYNGAGTV